MNLKSWCNIRNQTNMSSSRFLILTLILSIVWTSAASAKDDQRSKPSSLSEATAEKQYQNKLNNNNRPIFIDDNDDDFEGSGRKGEVQHALENEDDNDESGSGGFGDDEDDLRKPMRPDKTHLNKQDSSNTHHSGDGSDRNVDSESTDDDEDDYTENREDQTPLHKNDDIYFANSTDTISSTTTDDEDIGGGIDSRPKEQYPSRGSDPFDNGPSHHVPYTPTEAPNGGSDNVLIMNTSNEDRTTSFFAQPGILAAVIGGAVVGLLFAILVVMFIVYRMRKKDEGSYALDEPQKRSPQANSYTKNHNNREFYA